MKPNYQLQEKAIKTIAKELDKLLANTMLLYVQTLHCHWNLEDPRFFSLHTLFENQYTQLAENGDLLAEKIRQMGERVEGTMAHFIKTGSLKEITKKLSGNQMIEILAISHEEAISGIRKAIDVCEKHKDPGTVDLLSGILLDHEKAAWFLRSHL